MLAFFPGLGFKVFVKVYRDQGQSFLGFYGLESLRLSLSVLSRALRFLGFCAFGV